MKKPSKAGQMEARKKSASASRGTFWAGIALGAASSAAFGLIPFFTLPLYERGVNVETAIVYRFCVSALALALILKAKGERLKVCGADLARLAILGCFYAGAAIAYFNSFQFIPGSIAATIQFLYPVMVMLIMTIFFHEKFRPVLAFAVSLGVIGAALLSIGSSAGAESLIDGVPNQALAGGGAILGIMLALLSGAGNSAYMAGIQVARLKDARGLAMTFYVMLFGSACAIIYASATQSFHWLASPGDLRLALALALISTVAPNLFLILAIKRVGSTMGAALGVFEPLTAIAIGAAVFGERITPTLGCGIGLILISVLIVALAPRRQY